MLYIVRFLFISLLLTGPAAAEDNQQLPLSNKEEVWAAIDTHDFAAAEAIFANAHLKRQQGTIHPESTRTLFEVFGTNSPQVAGFADGWLQVYPESPFANIAQAWIHYRTGWYIRGEKMARRIYPGALYEFRELHDTAWHHAQTAYDADNSLRPASDALIRLANSTGSQMQALKVLANVMGNDPNMGTLIRALDMTNPGWGGSWKMVENMCDRYGPLIDWSQGDPVTYCKLYAFGTYHQSDDLMEWFKSELMSGRYPDLERLMLRLATHSTATRVEVEFARRYLNRDDVIEVDRARDFDMDVALKYDFEFLYGVHTKRAWDHAREAIKRDPYNPYLIETLQRGVIQVTRTETGYTRSNSEKLTREEQVEFARRKLVAAPYDPGNWQDYSNWLFPPKPENLLKDEPFRINRIVYSNHDAGSVLGYAFDKWRLLSNLQRLESDLKGEKFLSLSAEMQAEVRAQAAKWIAARARLDMDRDIKCPMMRAYRLYEFLCETSKSIECSDPSAETIEMLDLVRDEVDRRRACQGVMALDELELFYEPRYVDLSKPKG